MIRESDMETARYLKDNCTKLFNKVLNGYTTLQEARYILNSPFFLRDSMIDAIQQREHITYFIVADNGLIKIGSSYHEDERLKQLQTGSPEQLYLLLIDTENTLPEKVLHIRFAHLRHHGEWFAPGAELCEYIESVGGDYRERI